MSVAICTPNRGQVEAGYAKSLANLTANLSKNNIEHEVFMTLGSVVSQLRTDIASLALKKNFEWLLWLDSDMHFPHNTFNKLLNHNKEIVAATYSTRYKPQRSVAFVDNQDLDKRLEIKQGLCPVWAVGMGCMLTHRSVFEKLPKPWFNHDWDLQTESFVGEDIYFCKTAGQYGYTVYVDTDLSKEIGHYGTKIFLLQETYDY